MDTDIVALSSRLRCCDYPGTFTTKKKKQEVGYTRVGKSCVKDPGQTSLCVMYF